MAAVEDSASVGILVMRAKRKEEGDGGAPSSASRCLTPLTSLRPIRVKKILIIPVFLGD